MTSFDFEPRTRVVFGAGELRRLGQIARELGMKRVLVVADNGIVNAGYSSRVTELLECPTTGFHDFDANPDTEMVERGRAVAEGAGIDGIIGVGGGSSMDCAKGINFVLTNGGSMQDYWGHGKATKPMLPMIGIPTTTGTGSEAQSYALISHSRTHVKMACGDPKAAFRVAILDPELAVSQPRHVRAQAGYDALSHAVESFVTTKGSAFSTALAREAWRVLSGAFEEFIAKPGMDAVASMQWGAHLAGMAIENSMLGAAHACANPLTQGYGVAHGEAIAVMLPHVVEWNSDPRYSELRLRLSELLKEFAAAAELPSRLRNFGIPEADLPVLAGRAAEQWTGRFNPRPFNAAAALELYQCAY